MLRSKIQVDVGSVPVVSEDETSKSVVYKQCIGYDIDGNVLYDHIQRPRYQNGGGWVISYTEKVCDFLARVSTGSIVRVFLYIAHHQAYGNNGIFGMRCSHKHLQQALSLDRTTLWDAIKFLTSKNMLDVTKIDGSYEFMVNPDYVTIGADKKSRQREWLRRHYGEGNISPSVSSVVPSPTPSSAPSPVRRSARVDVDDVCEMN